MNHTYHFPNLWNNKTHDAIVAERHDIVLLFDATNCNPNGDPDTGNMPRIQPDTLRGLVTDVCLKRKIRNFWTLNRPSSSGYGIFISESAILSDVLQNSHDTLIRSLCENLISELQSNNFLTVERADDLRDKLTTVDALDAAKRPTSPDKCLAYVLDLAKGKLNCSPLVTLVAQALEYKTDFPQPCKDAISNLRLTGEQTSDSEKAVKAIEKAATDAAPRGTKPIVKTLLQAALQKLSPAAVLENRFSKIKMEEANRDALCQTYADVRAFGAVVSTEGPLKGSFYGQIRGPIQIAFAESLDKILQLDFSITRCAVASKEDAAKQQGESSDNRTMGRKHTVAYGLYRCHIHFSPGFAERTRFTYADFDTFLHTLASCFGDYNVDIASARAGGMRVVGLVDFEHSSPLGNAPAHKLFNMVKIEGIKEVRDGSQVFKSSGSEFPQGLDDYHGIAPDGELFAESNKYGLVSGVSVVRPANQNGNDAPITARRLIWEIASSNPNDADKA